MKTRDFSLMTLYPLVVEIRYDMFDYIFSIKAFD